MDRWLFGCLVVLSLGLAECQPRDTPCYTKEGKPWKCMTKFENAAFNRTILASNTCGISELQRYKTSRGSGICDASDPELAHPARLMTDRHFSWQPTWWQSESLFHYEEPVRLTLDLGKTFEVSFIRITFKSSRPQSFAIYKKTTTNHDAPWIPFQYFSGSCQKTYGVPNNGKVTRRNQKVALCTDKFSGISPLSGGNVAFSTLQDRPDAYKFDDSPELQDWVTAAAIRIDLDKVNTFGDEVLRDANVLRSYYFAISDVAIGGRCKCNGHASDCYYKQEVGKEARLVCNCKHNTAGDDCQKCKPLYNDKPWARAKKEEAHPCT